MNLTYLKYAVEVAECGGINKAAEKLLIQQSNLSRYIKELENDIGIKIFERTSKGVILTADGDEFIGHAKSLLRQTNEIENMYKKRSDKSVIFSASVPRSLYVCEAFLELNAHLSDQQSKLYYKENNSIRTIESLIDYSCNLGIIRSEKRYDKYFFDYIASKGIASMPVGKYKYRVTAGRDSFLSGLDRVTYADLRPLTQIAFADPYVPYVSMDTVFETEIIHGAKRNVFVMETMSAEYMLGEDPMSFMWCPPVTEKSLDRFGLVQKDCIDHHDIHSDILIWRRNYKFSDIDKYFIDAVIRKAKECGMDTHNR